MIKAIHAWRTVAVECAVIKRYVSMALLDANREKFYLSISLRHFDSRFVNRDIAHELDYDHKTPCSNRYCKADPVRSRGAIAVCITIGLSITPIPGGCHGR